MWPPPAAPVQLQAVAPCSAGAPPGVARAAAGPSAAGTAGAQCIRTAQAAPGAPERGRFPTAASEADTLASLQASPRGGKAGWAPAQGGGAPAAAAAGGKAIEPQLTLQAWQIYATRDAGLDCMEVDPVAAPAATAEVTVEEEAHLGRPPQLPSLRTCLGQGEAAVPPLWACTADEEAALYAGSPRKQARLGVGVSAADAALAAAATAVPAAAAAELPVSLPAELGGELVPSVASLQLLGFEQLIHGGEPAVAPPKRLHFTFRCFHSSSPVVSAPQHLAALGGTSAGDAAAGSSRLYALGADGSCAGVDPRACPPGPELPLHLLDVAALQQHAAELAAAGASPAVAAGLTHQLRLRLARYLAERRLQVDVWDSDSLLQAS